jgi:CoA:oxalate CoA-transferase
VIDLSHVLAGPLCTYELALMGASVLKIESPGHGDMYRRLGSDTALSARGMGTSFMGAAAGKRSLAIDLKTEEGLAIVHSLLRESDILVQNFRPGVAERLGIGYEECKAIRPQLVYCAISGFGQHGPMRDMPAVDHVMQGTSGMMAVTGARDGPPLRVGYAAADTASGLVAGMAVLGALVGAMRTGQGCFVDVSMLEACLVAQATVWYDYLNTGHVYPRVGAETLARRGSGGTFETADGWLVVSALSQETFDRLCHVVGRDDLSRDPRFAVNAGGEEHAPALRVLLGAAFRTGGAAQWVARLVAAGVPAGVLNEIPAVAALPHLAERGAFHSFESVPGLDRGIRGLNAGFELDGFQLQPRAPPPMLGADTRDVLRELGHDDAAIDKLAARGIVQCAAPISAP